MNHVDFTKPPRIGTAVNLDAQRYELIGVAPHKRVDGTPTFLLSWATECPRCGNMFVHTTGLVTKALNRRCEACRKRARRPVSGKRRSSVVQVSVTHA